MKLSTITPDRDLAQAGVWRDFGPEIDGEQMRLLIAWNGNEHFMEKQARLLRNATQQMAGRDLPQETQTKIQRKAMAGTILLGWENWDEEDGSGKIPDHLEDGSFNEYAAIMLLENQMVHQFVALASNRVEDFQKVEDAASKAAMKRGAAVESEVGQPTQAA